MQDHHGPAKETDITAVLVVALVLMVGVLIAKTAGDFTAKSTSTSTRAGFKKTNNKAPSDAEYKNGCRVKFNEIKPTTVATNDNTYFTYHKSTSGACASSSVAYFTGYVVPLSLTQDYVTCCVTKTLFLSKSDAYCTSHRIYSGNGDTTGRTVDQKCKTSCSNQTESSDTNNAYTVAVENNSATDGGNGVKTPLKCPFHVKDSKGEWTANYVLYAGRCCAKP